MAIHAMGSKLQIGANSIAELTSIGGLELSADTIEITNLDSSGWRNFIGGMKDAGEVSFQGFFNPADTNGQAALYSAFQSGALTAFTVLFPATLGASWSFNGIVTAFKTGIDMEEAASFEGTLKVSGIPTLGVTASANLTALSLLGTAGSISPAYAAGVYALTYSFTGTGLTITPTLAGATIKLYVDGVYVQDIVSGAASGNINFAAIGSKKLTLLVNEAGKTIKVYDIVAVRTA